MEAKIYMYSKNYPINLLSGNIKNFYITNNNAKHIYNIAVQKLTMKLMEKRRSSSCLPAKILKFSYLKCETKQYSVFQKTSIKLTIPKFYLTK